MNDRGRLTVPDIVFALMAVAFLGALWPAVYSGYQDAQPLMSTGTELLYLLIPAIIVLVLLFTLVRKSVRGYGR